MAEPAAPERPGVSFLTLAAIVVLGLIPIWGVLNHGWSALQIVMLFWVETVVVGVFTWMRLRDIERLRPEAHNPVSGGSSSLFLALHYGIFTLVHGVFVIVMGMVGPAEGWFDESLSDVLADRGFWMAVVGVVLLLGLGHWRDWARPEAWRTAGLGRELFRPYSRIIAMHIAVVGGVWVILGLGGAAWLVVLLCGLKLVGDLLIELILAGFRVRFEPVMDRR